MRRDNISSPIFLINNIKGNETNSLQYQQYCKKSTELKIQKQLMYYNIAIPSEHLLVMVRNISAMN